MNWKSVCMVAAATWALSTAGATAGDAAAGETLFKKCAPCHKIGEGAKNAMGPELNGLIGRAAGSVEGYNYSPELKASGIVWDEASLNEFLTNPKAKIPTTKMPATAAVAKDTDRENLIAFLAQFDAKGAKK
jgi:cytochrome c